MKTYLTVRDADVVHETLGGETVIIDLRTGNYYSVAGYSSVLFQRAMSGATRHEVLDWVVSAFPNEPSARDDAKNFLDGLVAAKLCSIVEDAPEVVADVPDEPGDYVVPGIEGYEDMAELLLLDPIHDVDPDAGWPTATPAD